MKKHFVTIPFLFVLTMQYAQAEKGFRDYYNEAAKQYFPAVSFKKCDTKIVKKVPGKSMVECGLMISNALLTVDGMNGMFDGASLMVDGKQLSSPTELFRAGAILLLAGRKGNGAGHFSESYDLMHKARKSNKEECLTDASIKAKFCVSLSQYSEFVADFIITPIK